MRFKQRDGSARGFTLIELIAALSVFAVLLVGLAASIAATARGNSSIQEIDVAREAARGQMETILAADFATVMAFDGTTFTAAPLTPQTGFASVGTVSIDNTNPALLVVTVRVAWAGVLGDDQLELSTFLADTTP
jgi:prepilin-type N-terminal cleavage/methylation domain-containing protein